jgi:TPR repeat protein
MPRLTTSSFRPAFWLILVAVLLATSACTRSNASADSPHSAPAQSSQPAPAQPAGAQPPQPPASDLAELQAKADAGDAAAMVRLGRLYATGSGVEKDYVEAFDWYKRAAAKGNPDAMYALGEAYEHGTGVRENVQTAVHWYEEAALHGSKPANTALARLGETIEDHP